MLFFWVLTPSIDSGAFPFVFSRKSVSIYSPITRKKKHLQFALSILTLSLLFFLFLNTLQMGVRLQFNDSLATGRM